MNLLGWLFQTPTYDRLADAYMNKRSLLWSEVKKGIEHQQASEASVWIVTHFPNQFLAAQDQLGEWDVEYRIIDRPLDPAQVLQKLRDDQLSRRKIVNLALAEMLVEQPKVPVDIDRSLSIAMIAIERHPLLQKDKQLNHFASSIPCRVRLGYYLALDDPLLQFFFPEKMLSFLHHFGMRDDVLADSMIVTRAIERALKKLSRQPNDDIRADSAQEWLEEWSRRNPSIES